MALLEKIQSIVPRWMITAPRDAFVRLMSGPAAMLEGLGEGVMQARFAMLPGQTRVAGVPMLGGFDSVAALFFIARDRLVTPAQISGLPWVIEKPWDLAARLQRWRDDWINNVGPFGFLDQMAFALVPNVPRLRFVQAGGGVTSWYTRETDGTRRLQRSDGNGWYQLPDGTVGADATVAQAWNWDTASLPLPPDHGDPSRGWIVAYSPFGGPYLTGTDGTFTDLGVVDDAYNNPAAQVPGQPTAGVLGTNAPAAYVALMQNISGQRRTAGNKTPWLIVAFDPLSFAPDGSSSGDLLPFAFADIANTTVTGGGAVVTKSGGAAAYDAFAEATATSGITRGGSVDYTVTALPAVVMNVGLAWAFAPSSVSDSWYGFNVYADGHAEVQEAGTVRTTIGAAGFLSAGALLRIAVNPNGSPTRYFVNHGAGWVLVYTSSLGPVFQLRAFVSLWTVGDTVSAALRSPPYPEGTWAWHTKPGLSGGLPARIIARLQTAEYWRLTDTIPTPAPPI